MCCYNSNINYKWKDFGPINIADLQLQNCKLKHCICSSSHNTLIGDLQIFGNSNINHLIKILNLNFRMIELDIFIDNNNSFIVSHGNDNIRVTTNVKLETCLQVISEYAWRCTDLPLFIVLELNFENNESSLDELMYRYFSDKIFLKVSSLGDTIIGDLKNKLIVLVSTPNKNLKCSIGNLYGKNKIMYNIPNTQKTQHSQNEFNLCRIYPSNFIISRNYDFKEFLNYTFISMNVTYMDTYMKEYFEFFDGQGIKKKRF